MADRWEIDKILMTPFSGKKEERLEYFRRVLLAIGCHSSDGSEKNMEIIYEAMLEETIKLTQPDHGRTLANTLKRILSRMNSKK
ncbi:hypothetical protein [Thiohalobacter thiocyanaticus]|uniref:hypothetical protein n=1 Tax=Thiohalobacter thiocyanaticus TaxID=585455 RepID=UPI000F6444C7|nr:hypothetical protein [Thiohalobacter thiocyanaticus]